MNKTNSNTHKNMYLSREEQNRYIAIAQGKTNAGTQEIEDAWKILFENNKGYIRACALKFSRKFTNNVVDADDFQAYAEYGFMTTVKKFDPARGFTLLTYAKPWIFQAMQRGSEPFAYCTSSSIGDRAKFRMGLKYQAQGFTRDEISELLGVDWAELQNMGRGCSLQEPCGLDDGSGMEIGDAIADTSNETAEEIGDRIDQEETLAGLKNILGQLPEEKRLPIMARCGFNGRAYTFDELRVFYGVKTASAAKKRYERDCADVLKAFSYMNLPLAG